MNHVQDDQTVARNLLNRFGDTNSMAAVRNELMGMAAEANYDRWHLGDYLAQLFIAPSPKPEQLGVHDWARRMVAAGYHGQGMKDEEQARIYILMAAEDRNVEDDLPEAGFRFWKAAIFQFRYWSHRQQR